MNVLSLTVQPSSGYLSGATVLWLQRSRVVLGLRTIVGALTRVWVHTRLWTTVHSRQEGCPSGLYWRRRPLWNLVLAGRFDEDVKTGCRVHSIICTTKFTEEKPPLSSQCEPLVMATVDVQQKRGRRGLERRYTGSTGPSLPFCHRPLRSEYRIEGGYHRKRKRHLFLFKDPSSEYFDWTQRKTTSGIVTKKKHDKGDSQTFTLSNIVLSRYSQKHRRDESRRDSRSDPVFTVTSKKRKKKKGGNHFELFLVPLPCLFHVCLLRHHPRRRRFLTIAVK